MATENYNPIKEQQKRDHALRHSPKFEPLLPVYAAKTAADHREHVAQSAGRDDQD
jgi:hypothetical protein